MASIGVTQPQSFPVQVPIGLVFEAKNQEDLEYLQNKIQDEDFIVDIKEFAEQIGLKLVSVNNEVIK